MDGHKASLSANAIAENLFAQGYDEGNRFVLFDAIVDMGLKYNMIMLL